MKRLLLSLMALALVAALGLATVVGYAWYWLNQPVASADSVAGSSEFVIQRGETVSHVADRLAQQGRLEYPRIWTTYAQYQGLATQIQAGQYRIVAPISPLALLQKFVQGEVEFELLRIIEGSRYSDMLVQLQAHEGVRNTLADIDMDELASQLGLESGESLEGWFYPDTMHFAQGTTDLELLRAAKQKMQAVLAEEWQSRSADLPYENAYQALIMASIVEKETGRAEERADIAGVFVRRLRKGMRLQTDPTVIYGLGAEFDGNLRRRDLQTDTPYNTYTRHGLPPTPIALPGRAAIHAALHPADGTALFFVAKGDGSHYFSATLEEHERAVQEYQIRRRRSNYRSSP